METLEQRMERTIQAEDEATSVIIPQTVSGSSSMRKIFSEKELERIKTSLSKWLKNQATFQRSASRRPWGVEVLKKVSLDTVINRIKYERCLRRASKRWMFKVKIKIALLKFVIVKAQLIYCYNDGRCFISYVYLISWDSQCDCIWIIFNEF